MPDDASQPTPEPIDVHEHRRPDHEIDDRFLERWSPRSFDGGSLSQGELDRLFEAARWAPSSYNGQPWRFVYAHRDTPAWDRLFDLLVEFNRNWAEDASVLIAVLSRKTFEHNGKPAVTHSFDTGAAWMNLALQAREQDLYAHAMQGFDADRAPEVLGVEDPFTVECMVAVGRRGPKDALPEQMQQQEQPNGRKPVTELAFEGELPESAYESGDD